MAQKKVISFVDSLIKELGVVKFIMSICVLLSIIIFFIIPAFTKKEYPPEVKVASTIEKIVNKSDLSTFQVTYNGVAEIKDKEDPKEVLYYVSYNSKTKAGFNIKDLKYETDKKNKEIIITIPEIIIQEPSVDIKLDYMFYDDSKDTLGITEEAYKACVEDVKRESKKEKAIYDIAKNNAKKLLESITKPFIQDMEGDYTLVIK